MRKATLVCLAAMAIVATAAVAGTRTAHLVVVSSSPLTVHGSGFRAHERVTLTVDARTSRTMRLLAGAHGGFRMTFRGVAITRCAAYVVRAKGNRGSTAVIKVIPECAPERATTTTDELLPQDPGAPKKPHRQHRLTV